MAAELFNSLGGFSVGIPAIEVIDSNGNVISNFNNLSGNVSANKIYASNYYYANGEPFTGGSGNGVPGGGNATVQYSNLGNFGGSSSFTFNSTTELLTVPNVNVTGLANLGDVSNISISGGTLGYILSTDGDGNLSWIAGSGTPGGSNTQLQFNNDGTFGGSPALTFDSDTDTLFTDRANITELNTGSIDTTVVQVTGNVNAANIKVTNVANISGSLRATGDINFQGSPNIYLGTVANVKMTGGVNGYVLTTDGLGNLSWQAGGGSGGNGTPGGANMQVQYNNNGVFAGEPNFTFNQVTDTVTIGGNLIANSMQIGSGVYKFSTSEVYFASTASTAPNQVLYSIPVSQISGVEFHIIATDSASGTRQSSKISSIYYAGAIQFNEYAGLQINGGVGNFEVDYYPGDIITPAALQLKVTPYNASLTVYKILITVFAE